MKTCRLLLFTCLLASLAGPVRPEPQAPTRAVNDSLLVPAGQVHFSADSLPDSLPEVIVTATRTARALANVPFPASVIGSEEIAGSGMVRLDEVLAEQTGLALVADHGTGVQIQGFAPDYTLVLLDGQPLIGRTAGTFELSRVAVGNIERIEIVKGPTSALYGSEALAGVINIITREPAQGTSAGFSARYGGNSTADLGVTFSRRSEKLSLSGFANRYRSNGYRLVESGTGPTVPPFKANTFQLKGDYRFNSRTELSFSGRYFDERQKSDYLLAAEEVPQTVDEKGLSKDLNLSASLRRQFSDRTTASILLYHSRYETGSDIVYRDTGLPYDASFFDQRFLRPELQLHHLVGEDIKLTGGAGWVSESVRATRYAGKKSFNSQYLYLQAEWMPLERFELVLGGRYDAHSEYRSQFSPRISGRYRFSPRLSAYVSLGRGYKAPDFRQLYLNFTNPVAGYSVFGSNELKQRLQELDEAGQLAAYIGDPSAYGSVNAESSVSYNAGLRYAPAQGVDLQVNLFRNDVKNLIESTAVARRTNGQAIYSYSNLNRIYTQGLEVDAGWRLSENFAVKGGYQLLFAYDKEVLSRLDKGEVFRRNPETGSSERVLRRDYAGLNNRSRHMANLKLNYVNFRYDFDLNLRTIYRGRYGYGDYNGNGIADIASEYVKGYPVMNLAVSKQLLENRLRLQLEVENLFDKTDPAHIPTLPGRLFYAGLNFQIGNTK